MLLIGREARVVRALLEHPDRSVAWLAADLGAAPRTVRRVRARLIAQGRIADVRVVVGRDGFTYRRPRPPS